MKIFTTRLSKPNGFTLIEMLIVVTIIGILAAIVMPRFLSTTDTARQNAHKTERQNINAQIELYHFNTGEWPTAMDNGSWAEPNGGGTFENYFPDGVPVKCNQDGAWAIDTVTHRLSTDGHDTHED